MEKRGSYTFDPKASLDQARRDQPLLDAAYTRSEAEKTRYIKPLIDFFKGLEEEIRSMPIAARFSRLHGPDFSANGDLGVVNPMLKYINEADYKRAQLLMNLSRARNAAMDIVGQIEDLVLDIEATKQD